MIWQITGKLLLKALLPLLLLIGVLNYGVYLRGGDPLALWKGVGQNMLASIQSTASNTASSLGGVKNNLQKIGLPSSASETQVFTWKDQNGTTHYSSSRPEGINAQMQRYDPDANVVQRFKAPKKPEKIAQVQSTENKAHQQALQPENQYELNLNEGVAGITNMPRLELQQLNAKLKARQQMLDQF